jgi:hypothetical protein
MGVASMCFLKCCAGLYTYGSMGANPHTSTYPQGEKMAETGWGLTEIIQSVPRIRGRAKTKS